MQHMREQEDTKEDDAFLGTFNNSSRDYDALVLQLLHLHEIIARNGVERGLL